MKHFLVSLVAMFALGTSAGQSQPAPTVGELRQRVVQLEREVARIQADLARARALLAHAEGKDRLAAEEWRKVVAYCEAEYKVWTAKGNSSWSEEDFMETVGQLAIARAHLAEVEHNRDALLRELPKVIAYHEKKIRRAQVLLGLGAMSPDEAREREQHHRAELRWPVSLLEATRSRGDEKKRR